MESSSWTSLEVVKLLVQALLPIVVLCLGVMFDRRTKRLEQTIWQAQRGVEWKQKLFDQSISDLNLIYCCFNYVGDWKKEPGAVIEAKRRLDSLLYGYQLLLQPRSLSGYEKLMDAAFETRRGKGLPIRLRANVDMFRNELTDWRSEYETMFVNSESRLKRSDFAVLYNAFMRCFFEDVGVGHGLNKLLISTET